MPLKGCQKYDFFFCLFYDKCAYILYYSIKFDYVPKHVMGEKWFLESLCIFPREPNKKCILIGKLSFKPDKQYFFRCTLGARNLWLLPQLRANCPHLSLDDDANSAESSWSSVGWLDGLVLAGLAVLASVWCDLKDRLTAFKSLRTKSFSRVVRLLRFDFPALV